MYIKKKTLTIQHVKILYYFMFYMFTTLKIESIKKKKMIKHKLCLSVLGQSRVNNNNN